MSLRTITAAFLLAAAITPAALASSGSTWAGGEAGFVDHPMPSQVTRAQVRDELLAFLRNPVDSTGGRLVGGEQGYVPHQHSYVVKNGSKVHSDGFAATMGINAAVPGERVEKRPGSENWEVNPY